MTVAMIGAGAYGSSLGQILEDRGHLVQYFDPAKYTATLAETTRAADYIVLALPSEFLDGVLADLPKSIPLIVATKGILGAGVFAEFSDVMVLSGPGFASDFRSNKKIRLTITDDRIRGLFGDDKFLYDFSTDVSGVLYCGALKNIYAMSAGFRMLLRESDEWERFIMSALSEMEQLLVVNGCKSETTRLYCGEADLRLTAGPPSRNYEYGVILASTGVGSNGARRWVEPVKTVEGLSALTKIRRGEAVLPPDAVIIRELMGAIWG